MYAKIKLLCIVGMEILQKELLDQIGEHLKASRAISALQI